MLQEPKQHPHISCWGGMSQAYGLCLVAFLGPSAIIGGLRTQMIQFFEGCVYIYTYIYITIYMSIHIVIHIYIYI